MTEIIRQKKTLTTHARTFFGAPLCVFPDEINADIAFLGVPYGSLGNDSSRAPEAIRAAGVYQYGARRGDIPGAGYYDYDTDTDYLKGVTMVDCGDVPIGQRDEVGNFRRITETVGAIIDRGAFPVVVGGSHSIAAQCLKAYGKYQPVDVVHIDAHHDFYPPPYSTGDGKGALRRIADEVPFAEELTTIGLRPRAFPQTGRDVYEDMKQRGVKIVTAKRFRELGARGAAAIVPESKRSIYVTLDIDVLDTPYANLGRPAGLNYLELSELLLELNKRGTIIGMDVVDVTPGGNSPLVAAQLILDLISARIPSKSQGENGTTVKAREKTAVGRGVDANR